MHPHQIKKKTHCIFTDKQILILCLSRAFLDRCLYHLESATLWNPESASFLYLLWNKISPDLFHRLFQFQTYVVPGNAQVKDVLAWNKTNIIENMCRACRRKMKNQRQLLKKTRYDKDKNQCKHLSYTLNDDPASWFCFRYFCCCCCGLCSAPMTTAGSHSSTWFCIYKRIGTHLSSLYVQITTCHLPS